MVRVGEIVFVLVVTLHDALPQCLWQHDSHVVVVRRARQSLLVHVLVSGSEQSCSECCGSCGQELRQVYVGQIVNIFLQDVGLAQLIDLYLHGVVPVSIIVVVVETYFAGVALDDAGGRCASGHAHHLILGWELIVLESVELCGEVCRDVAPCLWVCDGSQVADGAIGLHSIHFLGKGCYQETLCGACNLVGLGVYAQL